MREGGHPPPNPTPHSVSCASVGISCLKLCPPFHICFFPFPRPLKRHHHARAMVTFTSTRQHLLHAPIFPPAYAQASPSRARKGDFYEPSSAVHTRVHSPLFPSTLKRYLRAHSSKCSTRLLHISAQVSSSRARKRDICADSNTRCKNKIRIISIFRVGADKSYNNSIWLFSDIYM